MKVIKCPACGRAHKERRYCTSCGCYLPPILEEEIEDTRMYIPPFNYTNETTMYNNLRSVLNAYTQSELTNVANTVNYEMEKLRSQINADYIKLSQSMQTQYLINSFSARDEYGRIKAPKNLIKYQKMPTKNHYD